MKRWDRVAWNVLVMFRGRNSGLILIEVEGIKNGKARPKISLVKRKEKKSYQSRKKPRIWLEIEYTGGKDEIEPIFSIKNS